jgi:hypothetical protein
VTLWEQLGVSKGSLFNRKWKNLVESSTHPFHLFEIRKKNNISYITVKKEDEWSLHGTDKASSRHGTDKALPSDQGAIVHRETDAISVGRLRDAITKKGDACRAGRAAARVVESSPDRPPTIKIEMVPPAISPSDDAANAALPSETPHDEAEPRETSVTPASLPHVTNSNGSSVVHIVLSYSPLESTPASNASVIQEPRFMELVGFQSSMHANTVSAS